MRASILAAVLLVAACSSSRDVGPAERPPIDRERVESADVASRWAHQKSVRADLDGDGDQETVVLASDVTLSGGRPIWEDGHRWAVFVEEGGRRTLLYGAFVPNGFVEAALGVREDGGLVPVIITERTPRSLRVLEVAYHRAGEARLRTEANFPLEQWWPDSATLR